jgi:hypothetical protein
MLEGVDKNVGSVHGPSLVMSTFLCLFLTILVYSFYTHTIPSKHNVNRSTPPLNALLP